MKKKIIVFIFVFLFIFIFSLSAFADDSISISTPLLYQSDHTHSVLYVSNGVSTQCVVMEHEYWEDPEYNENLDFWVEYYPNYFNMDGTLYSGPHLEFLSFDNDELSMYVYNAFNGSLIYSSKYSELPHDTVKANYYDFPDNFTYVYKWNDYEFEAPVIVITDPRANEPLPINSIEYGKVYNVISSSDSPSLSSVQSVILAILNFLQDLVNTIVNTPLLLIPVGLFISFSIIALAFRLIRG